MPSTRRLWSPPRSLLGESKPSHYIYPHPEAFFGHGISVICITLYYNPWGDWIVRTTMHATFLVGLTHPRARVP